MVKEMRTDVRKLMREKGVAPFGAGWKGKGKVAKEGSG